MSGRTLLVVGCLNRGTSYFGAGRGTGIAVFAFDENTGALSKLSERGGIDNPNYLTVHRDNRCVYAVSEVSGWNEGVVTACRLDPATGSLRYIDKQATLGSITAYASFDRAGKFLLIANYSMYDNRDDCLPDQAIAVMPIRADGGIGAPVASRAHAGTGPNAARQERSHAHCILATPDNHHLVVADLGIDKMMVYRFDARTGALTPAEAPSFDLAPGAGPRHFVFDSATRFVYAINELDSTIVALSFDQAAARFAMVQAVPALPSGYRGESHCADLHLSADDRFLYGSNRGHDSIVIHAVDKNTGRLTLVSHQATFGKTPRNFAIDPSGRFLVAANQDSDSLVVFRVDKETGLLADSGRRVDIGTPMCVKFARF